MFEKPEKRLHVTSSPVCYR